METSSSVFDALFCEEQDYQWEEVEQETGQVDSFLEDEELLFLLSKEQHTALNAALIPDSLGRREAVEWMLMVNSYYGFSTLTALLSVNYLDRFLSKSPHLHHHDKPWMVQLAAVTCLSLAAKFEETHVPLLLDLQVEGTKYMFEAKTIEKMELLVLSTLDWKMNPVTAVSFLDHIVRRLGLKGHLRRESLRRCESLILSIAGDSRFVAYLPSVMATATVMQVIDQIHPCNPLDCQNQLLASLNINKDEVKKCYEMITRSKNASAHSLMNPPSWAGAKRQRGGTPGSPKGVMDTYYLSSDSSDHSWALMGGGLSASASVSSSPDPRAPKRVRVKEDANGMWLINIISYVAICLMGHSVLEDLVALFLVFSSYLRKRY